MMKMIWLVLWLVSASGVGWGQGTNTIFQTLSNNVNGNSVTINVRNIGQAYHLGTVLFRDNGINVCAVNTGEITIQGSHNNVVFFAIVQSSVGSTIPVGSAAYKFAKSIEGYGSYPYVRLQIQNTDNVNCNYDVLYSGNINSPDRSIAKMDPTAALAPSKLLYVESDVSAIGDTILVANTTGSRIAVYGLSIYNETAAQTLLVSIGVNGFAYKINMPAGFSMLYGINPSPYFVGLAGDTLKVNLTANTHTVIGVWYMLQ